jgi:hypothetical protein
MPQMNREKRKHYRKKDEWTRRETPVISVKEIEYCVELFTAQPAIAFPSHF